MITKIGIVGCYGSKKSYVTRIFAEMGIPVFSLDVVTSYFIEKDRRFKLNFLDRFSKYNESYEEFTSTNVREFLYKHIDLLEKFRKMINPFIKCYYEQWINSDKDGIVIIEDSNIVDKDIYGKIDFSIAVLANKDLRRNRLNKYFNLSNKETIDLINNDLSDDVYISENTYVLTNNSVAVFSQVIEIYNDIFKKIKLLT
jgi:dephospho-CoA kinase